MDVGFTSMNWTDVHNNTRPTDLITRLSSTSYPGTLPSTLSAWNWMNYSTAPQEVHHKVDNSTTIIYTIPPGSDKVLAVVIAIMTIFGIFMNIVVLWNLFARANALNRPSRQLHGNIALANFMVLLVCVPAISLVLFPGTRSLPGFKDRPPALNPIYCNISGYAFNVLTRQTIHLSTILALDRLLAVQFPIFHKFKLQKHGYKFVLAIIWIFNLVSCAAPFYVKKDFQLSRFECVCSWQITWLFINNHTYVKVFILLTYFLFPFTIMNLLTVISSVWVIGFLLRKNLVITMPCAEKSYRKLSLRNYNGSTQSKTKEEQLKGIEENSPMISGSNRSSIVNRGSQSEKVPKSKISVVSVGGRSMRFSMANLPHKVSTITKNANITITADAKVKRACNTMLLVIVLQLACYSVLQLLILDNFFYWLSRGDIFHGLRHKFPVISVIIINYPIITLIFGILNPAIIHFRLIISSRKKSKSQSNGKSTGLSRV